MAELRLALYEHYLVRNYNWYKFLDRAIEIHTHPELLRRVGMKCCIKLLTLHVRQDRTFEGHFASMIQNGHIIAILQRMAVLKDRQQKLAACERN